MSQTLMRLGDDPYLFPPVSAAWEEGLLAVDGDLSPTRLLAAYQRGIFPWFNANSPILWWSPAKRMVFHTKNFYCAHSLQKRLRKQDYQVLVNHDFSAVLAACASPRGVIPKQYQAIHHTDHDKLEHTWISPAMQAAYLQLHQLGHAVSIEVWQDKVCQGGLYGVQIGRMFYGESMFSRASNMSKIALAHLCRQLAAFDMPLLDCQMHTPHLASLGAVELERHDFCSQVAELSADNPTFTWPKRLVFHW